MRVPLWFRFIAKRDVGLKICSQRVSVDRAVEEMHATNLMVIAEACGFSVARVRTSIRQ